MPVKQYLDSPIIAWNGLHQPKWTERHMSSMANEGFRKNVIAYRCITQIAMPAATVPLLAYDERGREIAKHSILDLLANPNPLQDGFAFFESIYANLQIFGNAFIEVIRHSSKSQPSELYVLRLDRMKVIPGSGALPEGYVYSVDNKNTSWSCDPITGASDILHIKTFHPLNDWYGFAPLEAAMQSIDQHNSSGAWNQALLNQGARPSGALVYSPKDGTPASLSDEQVVRLREQISQMYQSYQNAGRPLILEGGLDWKEMSLSPKDMDWLSGRNNAARDIALAFGVPAQLVGIPDTQTYANMEQARISFYEETVIPQLTKVVFSFDRWLCPMYEDNPSLDFDIDSINALVYSSNINYTLMSFSPTPSGVSVVRPWQTFSTNFGTGTTNYPVFFENKIVIFQQPSHDYQLLYSEINLNASDFSLSVTSAPILNIINSSSPYFMLFPIDYSRILFLSSGGTYYKINRIAIINKFTFMNLADIISDILLRAGYEASDFDISVFKRLHCRRNSIQTYRNRAAYAAAVSNGKAHDVCLIRN